MAIRPRLSLLDPGLQRPSALQSQPRDQVQIWLDKNENLDPTLMALSRRVLQQIPQMSLATYPEVGALYRKLGMWAGVAADSLLLTPGSDGAIRLVFEAFVEPGDSVVITEPTFAMYPVYGQMFGARILTVPYQADEHGPHLDFAAVTQLVCERAPKIMCLPNPDSPTGTVVNSGKLEELLAVCEEAGSVLLVDEAYHPFYAESLVAKTKISRNLIVARTFAKAWGAAGLRIGYAVAHPETIALLHKMRPMYEVSTLAAEFMTRMLDHADEMKASVDRILAGKAWFSEEMTGLGFKVLPTFGNFSHVQFGDMAPVVHHALQGKVLYRKAFEFPALMGYSRFTMAPKEVLKPVVGLIQRAVRG